MAYDNTNRGFIRKNDRKEKDTHPDYTGELNVNGEVFWLSAWLAEHENMGGKYFQISVKPKEFKEAKEAVAEAQDDEIPF